MWKMETRKDQWILEEDWRREENQKQRPKRRKEVRRKARDRGKKSSGPTSGSKADTMMEEDGIIGNGQ